MNFSNRFVSECREYSSYVQHVKAPVFRKSFVLKEGSQSGEILICGLVRVVIQNFLKKPAISTVFEADE